MPGITKKKDNKRFSNSRKIIPQPEHWKKNKDKAMSCAPAFPPIRPRCIHTKKSVYKCSTLTAFDVYDFHKLFYSKRDKQKQDNFLLKHMEISKVERRRVKAEYQLISSSTCSAKYFIRNQAKELVQICYNAFSKILHISKTRLNRIAKEYYEKGYIAENRGGVVPSIKEKSSVQTNDIAAFMSRLNFKESHYCRGKSMRKYLSCDLNIEKLYRMYKEWTNLEDVPKSSYFRFIFTTEYNIGFGSPASDVCSTCLSYSEKIKAEKDEEEKQKLRAELAIHKKKASAFFEYLQDDSDDLFLCSFDCEKNQPLPKVPDSAAYYSRQIYLHNFTAVIGHSKSKLRPENVKCFLWTENQFKKNANLISSCIFYLLNTTNLSKYKKVRLVADGCGGQNKNTIMVTMCVHWLANFAPKNIEEVMLVFPVTGHSFIPPDRVFGRIERVIKRKEIIVNPNEMVNLIGDNEFGDVIDVASRVTVFNFKNATNGVIKRVSSWPFQISKMKRIYIRRNPKSNLSVEVKGEPYYYHDTGKFSDIFLRKKSPKNIKLSEIFEGNSVQKEKKTDVEKLLVKHFGENWRMDPRLGFFIYILDASVVQDSAGEEIAPTTREEEELVDNPSAEGEVMCETPEESLEFIV